MSQYSEYSVSRCGCRACSDVAIKDAVVEDLKRRAKELTFKQSGSECLRLSKELAHTRKKIKQARGQLRLAVKQLENRRREFSKVMDKDIQKAFSILTLHLIGAVLTKNISEVGDAFKNFDNWRKEFNAQLPRRVRDFIHEASIQYQRAIDLEKYEIENEGKLMSKMRQLSCDIGFFSTS